LGYSAMNDGKTDVGQLLTKWFIDVGWFEQNGRSFSVMARGCLCPKCFQKLKPDSQTVSNDRLLKTIKDCCSKTPDFIHARMPALESVFRLLLSNGNKPIVLEDITRQLGEKCGVGIYRISENTLFTLLRNDQYYGLSQMVEKS